MEIKLAIVVPNWNGADFIAPCLQSLLAQTINCSVIVVDNGSVDNSLQIIKIQFPQVILIELPKNTGFAGGVNTGIKYAMEHGAKAVALFNNDAVAKTTWLQELVSEMDQNPSAGIVTGKLMRSDKLHIDSTGDYYSTWGIPFPRGRNHPDSGQFDKPEPVFAASGGASLYRAVLLQEIGLFDERFFAYYEDVDISFRAQLAGWGVRYTPKAVAYHHVGATSSKLGDFTRFHSIKNFLLLYTKCMPAKLYWKYLPVFLYQFARTTLRSVIDRKPQVWLKAVVSFVIMVPGLLRDRWNIQKKRKVPTDAVEQLLHTKRPPKIPEL